MSADDGLRQIRAEIIDLEARKHDLELQIESDQAWLLDQGLDPTQVPLQLVDQDGFPKVGVDHHGARLHVSSMRSAINDHKQVMTRLGDILNEYHELLRTQKATGSK